MAKKYLTIPGLIDFLTFSDLSKKSNGDQDLRGKSVQNKGKGFRKKGKGSWPVLVLLFVFTGSLFVWYLIRDEQDYRGEVLTDPDLLEGRRLSEAWCSSCHAYPEPELLPWRAWRFETLPAMRPFLGLAGEAGVSASSDPWQPDGVYPAEPLVSEEEWDKIRDYYLRTAPQELEPAGRVTEIVVDSLFFRGRHPIHSSAVPPQVTAMRMDPGNRLIYIGEAGEQEFQVYDAGLDQIHSRPVASALSEIRILGDASRPGSRDLILTEMGIMDPSDAPYGSVRRYRFHPDSAVSGSGTVLVDSIARPVQAQLADLTGDGREELLVNEFGHRAGSLFWMKEGEDVWGPGKNTLIDTPGCIRSRIMDYTGNSRPDILALCTQVDQALYLFRNYGGGEFDRQTLFRFEVTAGSSSFEIHDFNGDGHPDILYTSGDNADFSKVYKPYHGVYIYLNDGEGRFEEAWFYPVNGAYDAQAEDFTGDGRLDLAVISYFADYEQKPQEGFLIFLNEGGLSFTPYHHPDASASRWLSMDVADWTGNGRPDILLGNFSEGPLMVDEIYRQSWRDAPPFLLLENQSDMDR